ncbi:hypothetical protein [Rhizobium sp. X9]|uniref:hypothetical protein n=1 Tax=Rhizobium sp. X9 TaxID=2815360 RepID=UPI001C0ABE5C|nr:hypothetical protein [Rhizobium sp. X9]
MKHCFALIYFTILCFGAPYSAASQEFVMEADRQRVAAFVDRTLKGGRSNVAVRETVSGSVAATVVPRPMISRATGEICDRCIDFCRDYSLTIELDSGLDTMIYSGRSCIVTPNSDPSSGPWAPVRPLALSEQRSIIPAQTLSETKDYLRQLDYLPSGKSTATYGVMSALAEFRRDAKLPQPSSYQVNEDDLRNLRRAVANLGRSSTCRAASESYVACGRLN